MKAEHFAKLMSELDIEKVAFHSTFEDDKLIKLSPEVERLYAEAKAIANLQLDAGKKKSYFWKRNSGQMFDEIKRLGELVEDIKTIDEAYKTVFDRVASLVLNNVHTLGSIASNMKLR